MTKTVTATEAKNRLGALMSEVIDSNDAVLIELRGRPKIALVSVDRLRQFEELERKERHRRALENLERLSQRIAEDHERRNIPELTEEEAMDLAVEVIREVRADMAAERQRQPAEAETLA
jgi:prevent-host-death family protein